MNTIDMFLLTLDFILAGSRENASPKMKRTIKMLVFPMALLPKRIILLCGSSGNTYEKPNLLTRSTGVF